MSRDPELTRLLTMELQRHLVGLEERSGNADVESLETTRRSVHALKGSAGLAGEPELAALMQRLEKRLRSGDASAQLDIVGAIKRAIARLEAGETATVDQAWPEPPPDLYATALEPALRSQYVTELTDRLAQIDEVLGTTTDVVDMAGTIYRHVHTMKGAASAAGAQAMAWFCHGLEERLRYATTQAAATTALEEVAQHRAVLGGLLEDPESALAVLRGLSARQRPSHRPSQRPSSWPEEETRADGAATVRVSAQAVDRLLDHVGGIAVAREHVAARVVRASVQARTMRKLRADLTEALRLIGPPRPWGAPAAALRRVEEAAQTLVELGDELDQIADDLDESDHALKDNAGAAKKVLATMRQTPIRRMFARLSASVLSEARRTGQEIKVRTTGGDEPIDRRLAEQLVEPCLQLARNAIAHGLEPASLREAMGKSREANLTFSARRVANRLVVLISDDGAGVDIAAVRRRAVESGIVTEVLAEAADDQTLLELLFLPGFSMRGHSPDLLAGRGIGLDITLASVQKLGGSIRLSSRPHIGFEARIDVPIETGLARVLWVTAGGIEHALPVPYTRGVRLNEGPDAERVPHLAACLEPANLERALYAVDLDVGFETSSLLAVGVDAVGATEEVLVRELSPLLRGIGPFAGAIVRGDGSLRLALDVHALAPRARALGRVPEGRVSEPASRPPPSRPPSSR
jgi:two-component system chemotaxis sensor kinase CheA